MTLNVRSGAVDVGMYMDENPVDLFGLVNYGGDVRIGTNCTIDASAAKFVQHAGTLRMGVSVGQLDIDIEGGTLITEKDFGDSDLIQIFEGATYKPSGSTIADITFKDGSTMDATDDPGSTFSICRIEGNVNWIDPYNRITLTEGHARWTAPTS